MGRPKIVRKAEEAANVPADQPIQVELMPDTPVEIDAQADEAAKKAAAEEAARKAADNNESEELTSLKKQLEDLKTSAESQRKSMEDARTREAALRKRADDQEQQLKTSVSARYQAEYDAVINAIGAATAEQESAENTLRTAGENQDWAAMTKAQTQLAKAASRLDRLEEAKVTIETRAKEAEEDAKKPRQAQDHGGDPVEAHIDNIPSINDAQKTWLKSHRELVTNNTKNIRLQNAHLDAIEEKGLTPGTDPYFRFLEEKLGYRKAEPTNDDDDDKGPVIVGAPPSRDTPSAGTGRPTSTRVTLSADERESARASGITDIEYAKQKLALIEAKKSGRYGDH